MYQTNSSMSASAGIGQDETTPLIRSPIQATPDDTSAASSPSSTSNNSINNDDTINNDGTIDNDQPATAWTLDNSARRLYVSHFLSAWNSRVFEFGGILYLASIFPGTLLPLSVYAIARLVAAITLSSLVGQYIDCQDRLKVVRLSIVSQRVVVAVSCVIFLILGRVPGLSQPLKIGLLALLAVMGCIEKLASMMNLLSVERDWVVVVAKADVAALRTMNSRMRRIDLICKLLGPFFIGIMDGISTETAILINLAMNCISVVFEYFSIAKVYKQVPELQLPKLIPPQDDQNAGQPRRSLIQSISKGVGKLRKDLGFYFKHPALIPSFSGALLYCTVLSFSGVMVTYLLSCGYTSAQISLARAVSVAFEVLATWVGPWTMTKIGPVRAGLWFSTWQLSCLALGVSVFWIYADNPLISTLGLVGGSILSRIGLWGFDLSTQIIIQEEVEAENRGAFSAVEASWQSVFEMCSYVSTITFSSPDLFHYPTTLSVAAVFCAWTLYGRFVRVRRGHLIHWPACISPEKHQTPTGSLIEALPRGHRDNL